MALGYRMEAISIICTEVMQPRGLTGLAFDTLTHSAKEVGEIVNLLANKDNFPMMIHCTRMYMSKPPFRLWHNCLNCNDSATGKSRLISCCRNPRHRVELTPRYPQKGKTGRG